MWRNFIEDFKTRGQIYLKIKVRTGATASAVKEVKDGVLKINLKSRPEKGKANSELIKILSQKFFVSQENIEIRTGKNKNYKIVLIKSHLK